MVVSHLRNQSRARLFACSERWSAAPLGPFTTTAWRRARMLLQSTVMVSVYPIVAAFPSSFFGFTLFYPDLLESLSLIFDDSVAASEPRSAILVEKLLSRSVNGISPSRTTASMRNGEMRRVFRNDQSLSFTKHARSPRVARRRTFVIERQIFSPALAKVHLTSMETNVEDFRDPLRTKSVTVSLRDLFPMNT